MSVSSNHQIFPEDPICLEPIFPGDDLAGHRVSSTIRHIFHEKCLKKWSNEKDPFPCPLCRKELTHRAFVDLNPKRRKEALERFSKQTLLASVVTLVFFAGSITADSFASDEGKSAFLLYGVTCLLSIHLCRFTNRRETDHLRHLRELDEEDATLAASGEV